MNWYKHFQNENEFLERSHDYDPNWIMKYTTILTQKKK